MAYTAEFVAGRIQTAERELARAPIAYPPSEILDFFERDVKCLDGIALGISRKDLVEPLGYDSLESLNHLLLRFCAKIHTDSPHEAIFALIRSGRLHIDDYLEGFSMDDLRQKITSIEPLQQSYLRTYVLGNRIDDIAAAHGVRRSGVSQALQKSARDLGFRDKLHLALAYVKLNGFPLSPLTQEEFASLTSKEIELLQYMGQGLTSQEIASRMGYHFDTIKRFEQEARKKLHVSLPNQAVLKLIDNSIISINTLIDMSDEDFIKQWSQLTKTDLQNLTESLRLYILNGDKYEDVGKVCNLDASTIESRIFKIKQRLGISGPAIQLAIYWRKARQLGLI